MLRQIGVGAGGLALAGTMAFKKANASADIASNAAQSDIVFHGTGFAPMVLHLIVGEAVTITSASGNELQLNSAPDAPEKIAVKVKAGATLKLNFGKPGLYLIYDELTTYFDTKVKQVVARKSAKHFPLPAYMIILVTDKNGRGPKTTDATINIPDSYMTFEPWAIVVNAGDPITFVNDDMDMHIVMPSPEPMLMPKVRADKKLETSLWQEQMNSFDPITLDGHGGKGILTIAQPGLHHYFCPVHAVYSSDSYTFAPLKSFGGYPFIMDGVIVVLPK
ncbi:MAG: hypothetical protein EPN46_13065 [Candidimonas sp.]|nr:MAG: hypothetical protein EPN62_05370 [Candidimonas sp.]TAM74029.1 MAG: hypothetical protein EPN46_13065 [Candidimonas sp.]